MYLFDCKDKYVGFLFCTKQVKDSDNEYKLIQVNILKKQKKKVFKH